MITETPNAPSLSEALKSACETRGLHIDSGILAQSPHLFREQFGTQPAIVIADENTFAAAGRTVVDAFNATGHKCLEPFIFRDPGLYAEHRYVVQLEAALKICDAVPIAVGAGTINDITKLAAHRLDRQYMSVATAASMDGYTAFGASITFEGSKQTFNCPAPTLVVADLDTICIAPPEMNASGYADLLAKTTAGADWLVADALGIEPVDERAWNIVQGGLHKALA
ncbi:MAG TPA: iron-containing alcohol dehydrogenase, partial [Candidatus Binatia bacterium]|nr:iron-containing alcohol dehydrogenase [Candidatus Binatia bacterium]